MTTSRPPSDGSPLSAKGDGPSLARDLSHGPSRDPGSARSNASGFEVTSRSRTPRHEREISGSSATSDSVQSPHSASSSNEVGRRTLPLGAKGKSAARGPPLVLVTLNHEQLHTVDVGGLTSAAALRERMLSRVQVADDEMPSCSIHWGQIGALDDIGPALSDAELLDMCQHAADLPNYHAFVVQDNGPLAYASPSAPTLSPQRPTAATSLEAADPKHGRNGSRSTISEEVADYMLHSHPVDTDEDEPLVPQAKVHAKSRWAKSRISDPAPARRLRSDSDPHMLDRIDRRPSPEWPASAGVAEGDERQRRESYFEGDAPPMRAEQQRYVQEEQARRLDFERRRERERAAQQQPQPSPAQPRTITPRTTNQAPQISLVPTPPMPSSARMGSLPSGSRPAMSAGPSHSPHPDQQRHQMVSPTQPQPRRPSWDPTGSLGPPPRNVLPARSMDDMRMQYSHSQPLPPGPQPMQAYGSQQGRSSMDRAPRQVDPRVDPRGPRPDARYAQQQVDPRLYEGARHALGPRQMGGPPRSAPPQQGHPQPMPQGPYIRPPPIHPQADARRQPPPLNTLPPPPSAPHYAGGPYVVYTQRPPPGSRMVPADRLPHPGNSMPPPPNISPNAQRPPPELLAGRYVQQRPPQNMPPRGPSPVPPSMPVFDARQRLPLQPGEVLQEALSGETRLARQGSRPPPSPNSAIQPQQVWYDDRRPQVEHYPRSDDGRAYPRRPSNAAETPRLPPRRPTVGERDRPELIEPSQPPAQQQYAPAPAPLQQQTVTPTGRHTPSSSAGSSSHSDRPPSSARLVANPHPGALTPGRATPRRSDEQASSPRRSSDREDESASTRTYSSSGRPSSRSSATSLESPVMAPPPPACPAAPSAPELWEDDFRDDPEGATYRPSKAAVEADDGTATARAEDWRLRLNFESGDSAGSLGLLDSGTLRPSKSTSTSTTTAATDFGDFDDDIEASTWQMAPSTNRRKSVEVRGDRPALRLQIDEKPPPKPLPQPLQSTSSTGSSGSRTISTTKSDSSNSVAATASTAATSVVSPRAVGQMRKTSSGTTTKTNVISASAPSIANIRRATMREDVRPSAEQLYDNLDVWFPDHDLDKPILVDPSTAGPSSASTGSPSSPHRPENAPLIGQVARSSAGIAAAVASGAAAKDSSAAAGKVGRQKSIRVIVKDRQKETAKLAAADSHHPAPTGHHSSNPALRVASALQSGANLLRRKSTKLWGNRVEEVTPNQERGSNPAISVPSIREETSDDDPDNFSFKWVKGELIGKGSYGKVFIGLNVTTGDVLAVKQVELPKSNSDREDDRQSGSINALKYEIETLKDLDHPHIVQYLGFEQTVDHLSIFLEYVSGGSVGRWVRKFGKFEESVVQSFASQILDGLAYLHAGGILHRDLKADNCLVDKDGIIKISDFGISKRSNNVYEANEGMSMQGSIFWMAPEVVHNAKKGYSAKVDIWSLGCVVLEMFAGRRPWDAEFAIAAMFKLGAERLAPPVPDDVVLSPNAEAFLSRCFVIDPDKRPTASDLRRDPLMSISPSWSFSQTLLSKAISNASSATPPASTPHSTHMTTAT